MISTLFLISFVAISAVGFYYIHTKHTALLNKVKSLELAAENDFEYITDLINAKISGLTKKPTVKPTSNTVTKP